MPAKDDILALLQQDGPLSRASIQAGVSYAKSTVNEALKDLIKNNQVVFDNTLVSTSRGTSGGTYHYASQEYRIAQVHNYICAHESTLENLKAKFGDLKADRNIESGVPSELVDLYQKDGTFSVPENLESILGYLMDHEKITTISREIAGEKIRSSKYFVPRTETFYIKVIPGFLLYEEKELTFEKLNNLAHDELWMNVATSDESTPEPIPEPVKPTRRKFFRRNK